MAKKKKSEREKTKELIKDLKKEKKEPFIILDFKKMRVILADQYNYSVEIKNDKGKYTPYNRSFHPTFAMAMQKVLRVNMLGDKQNNKIKKLIKTIRETEKELETICKSVEKKL